MGKNIRDRARDIAREGLWERLHAPAQIRALIRLALRDLWDGPYPSSDEWPGYCPALRQIHAWASRGHIPGRLWVDIQSEETLFSEPQGYTDEETGQYVEPLWEDYYHFEGGDIYRLLFGELIGNGLNL